MFLPNRGEVPSRHFGSNSSETWSAISLRKTALLCPVTMTLAFSAERGRPRKAITIMSDWILYEDPVQIPVQRLPQMEEMMARLGLSIVGCSPGCLHVHDSREALSDRKKGVERRQVIRSRVAILTKKWQFFRERIESEKQKTRSPEKDSVPEGNGGGQSDHCADAGLHAQGS